MTSGDLVTIGIPTYKRLSYLQEAVNSALSQTYPFIEILIGQDPTSEGLEAEIQNWCKELISKDQRVKYFFNKYNLGLAGNWNKISENASGEYIIIIGDDDRLLPDCIECLMNGINQGCNVSFSNQYFIDSMGNRLAESETLNTLYNRNQIKDGIIEDAEKVIWQNTVPMSSSLISTKLVRTFKFSSQLNTPEIELFLKIQENGGKFFFTAKYLTEYRLHQNSATSAGLKIHLLMEILMTFPVKKINQSLKEKFLESLSVVSVNNYLKENNRKSAWKIFKSKYYGWSNRLKLKGMLQLLLFILPGNLINLVFSLKNRLLR